MNEMKIRFEDIKEIIIAQDRDHFTYDQICEFEGKKRLLNDEIRINDTGGVLWRHKLHLVSSSKRFIYVVATERMLDNRY